MATNRSKNAANFLAFFICRKEAQLLRHRAWLAHNSCPTALEGESMIGRAPEQVF